MDEILAGAGTIRSELEAPFRRLPGDDSHILRSDIMTLSFARVIDLTHTLHPDIPLWPGDPPFVSREIASIGADGYYLRAISLCEHTGTHFGAPAHFHAEGLTADGFRPDELVRHAVNINMRERCAEDADIRLDIPAIEEWEHLHGRIPEGGIVLVDTGWSARWGDPAAYLGTRPGEIRMHFPGISLEAARFLAETRGVIGLGIDTPGIDGGMDEQLSVNAYWLSGRRYHLENLTSLDQLPPTGAIVVVGVLKMEKSSGGPARILALV